jgi:hypothetical protein
MLRPSLLENVRIFKASFILPFCKIIIPYLRYSLMLLIHDIEELGFCSFIPLIFY